MACPFWEAMLVTRRLNHYTSARAFADNELVVRLFQSFVPRNLEGPVPGPGQVA